VFLTHSTVLDVEDCDPAGVVVSVTVFDVFLRKVCEVVAPDAEEPSPKFQL